MKRWLLVWLFVCALPLASSARGYWPADYMKWCTKFIAHLQKCDGNIAAFSKEFDELIQLKPPTTGAGIYYNLWFVDVFCYWVEKRASDLAQPNGDIGFKYVLNAMPDLEGSEEHYQLYLEYVVATLRRYKTQLGSNSAGGVLVKYLQAVCPRGSASDRPYWSKSYEELQREFPRTGAATKQMKTIMEAIKPVAAVSLSGAKGMYVSEEWLLNIRRLAMMKDFEQIAQEVDQVLSLSDESVSRAPGTRRP